MKIHPFLILTLLAAGLAEAASTRGHARLHPKRTVQDTSLQLQPTPAQLGAAVPVGNRRCPVDGKPVDSASPVQVVWRGRSLALSGEACRQAFARDPQGHAFRALWETQR